MSDLFLQILYEFAFVMGDINEPFLLLSAIPRKEISCSESLLDVNVDNSTIVVEKSDDGFDPAKVGLRIAIQ